jgi:hypothetical protein
MDEVNYSNMQINLLSRMGPHIRFKKHIYNIGIKQWIRFDFKAGNCE